MEGEKGAGETDTLGQQFETALPNTVKVTAKTGYAVAGLSVKVGFAVDGLSITFMKVVDGKLDPKDSYESEWVGVPIGSNKSDVAKKMAGDGTPIVGIFGKSNGFKMTSGLGLLMLNATAPSTQGKGSK